MASRPKGKSVWYKKHVLVISASPGSIGGAFAIYAVKQFLLHLNAVVNGKPEFTFGNAYDKFDVNGRLIDSKTEDYINNAIQELGLSI